MLCPSDTIAVLVPVVFRSLLAGLDSRGIDFDQLSTIINLNIVWEDL